MIRVFATLLLFLLLVACGGDGDYALEAAIVGIVDEFDVPGAPDSWRLGFAREDA